ncbi:unnamed protein product [Prorocentrum cordatum]|uniref:Uncharacterized protein n=1 Tax=Prorocentrum cordatum TaxID=2364126 RepID=A0ABN9VBD0_9DINO|nr:unnamed protein product [Polarella glacialis]
MPNFGNTRYLNAVAQALIHCKPWRSLERTTARVFPTKAALPSRVDFARTAFFLCAALSLPISAAFSPWLAGGGVQLVSAWPPGALLGRKGPFGAGRRPRGERQGKDSMPELKRPRLEPPPPPDGGTAKWMPPPVGKPAAGKGKAYGGGKGHGGYKGGGGGMPPQRPSYGKGPAFQEGGQDGGFQSQPSWMQQESWTSPGSAAPPALSPQYAKASMQQPPQQVMAPPRGPPELSWMPRGGQQGPWGGADAPAAPPQGYPVTRSFDRALLKVGGAGGRRVMSTGRAPGGDDVGGLSSWPPVGSAISLKRQCRIDVPPAVARMQSTEPPDGILQQASNFPVELGCPYLRDPSGASAARRGSAPTPTCLERFAEEAKAARWGRRNTGCDEWDDRADTVGAPLERRRISTERLRKRRSTSVPPNWRSSRLEGVVEVEQEEASDRVHRRTRPSPSPCRPTEQPRATGPSGPSPLPRGPSPRRRRRRPPSRRPRGSPPTRP